MSAASGAAGDAPGGVLRVACVQLNTRDDVAANVRAAVESVEAAADQGARLVALPETWAFKGRREGIVATAEPPDGPSNRALAAVAARRGSWLLAGSVYEPARGGLVSNVSALFDPAGDLRAVYRKIHLFDVTSGAVRYEESGEVEPGRGDRHGRHPRRIGDGGLVEDARLLDLLGREQQQLGLLVGRRQRLLLGGGRLDDGHVGSRGRGLLGGGPAALGDGRDGGLGRGGARRRGRQLLLALRRAAPAAA